jgi:RHS repeat-associated protein
MLPASTHLNLIIGIDIHAVMVPTPAGPIPTPLPHAFIGYLFDIGDLLPIIGATVFINYKIRGCSFTGGMLGTYKHLPTPPGTIFVVPTIGHDAYNFFGSLKVKAEGNLLAASPYMSMTCNDIGLPLSFAPGKHFKPIPSMYLPNALSVPIPTGKLVLVGGPYVPDLAALVMSLVMSFGLLVGLRFLGRALNRLLQRLGLECTQGLSTRLCRLFGEPVDLATGRVIYQITDFEIPGPIPIKWERNWYSDSGYKGMLGHGSHLCYDLTLITDYKQSVIGVILPDGRATAFPLLLNNEQSSYNRSEKLTLTNKGDYFELKDHTNELIYHFIQFEKNKYKPVKLSNYKGFSIQFNYDSRGKLANLIDCAGRNILLTYDGQGRVTAVNAKYKGHERELVKYNYNDDNDLSEITDALDQTTYIRYKEHLMVEKTDRNGQSFYWEYEGKGTAAKCIHTWGDNGLLEGWIKYTKKYTEVTNSLNETTKYFYNDLKLCTKIIDPLGNSVEYVYTDDMEIYREIDEEGNIKGYTYDNRGNLTGEHFADGSSTLNLYNEDDQLLLKMDAAGQAIVFTYNEDKLIRSIKAPDGGMASFAYNNKQLISVSNEKNEITKLTYDEDYNLSRMDLPGGAVTKWEFNSWGQCISVINPEGNVQSYAYDKLGRINKMQKFDKNIVELKYNAYEDITVAEDKHYKVEFNYNALGSLISRVQNKTAVIFKYDSQNRLLGLKNEFNEAYTFKRNGRGDVINEIGFDGVSRKYERDRAGKVIRTQRPGGKYTTYEYDLAGRMVRAEYSDDTWETFSYNKNGQLIEAFNENSSIQICRDSMGRITSELSGEHWVKNIYDASGKRINVSSGLGANINHEFNKDRTVSKTSALVNDNKPWDAEFKYNRLGLETERNLPGGVQRIFEYDAAGNPIKEKVSVGSRESLNRTYSWDANYRLTKMVNQLNKGIVNYGHDDFGNLAWAQYEDQVMDYRMPDAAGNLYKTKEKKDRKYGAGGRLLESEDALYKYDEEGNLVNKKEKNGKEWRYEWKGNGMLQKVVRPDGKAVSFEYDALGRRLSKTCNGQITRWLWNGNVPLHEWKYKETEKPKPVINEFGELFDDKQEPITNLISWIFDEGSFKPTAKIDDTGIYSIITDYLGTPIEMYNDEGQKTWQAEYDIRGRIRKLDKGSLSDCPFRYQGQYEDEETGLFYNRFRYYASDEGIYINQDPIDLAGGLQFYGYVMNTNAEIDPLGLISWLEHITNMTGRTAPAGMENPHGHHIVFQEGQPGRMRTAVMESQEILSRYGIDLNGRENMIIAPNRGHSIEEAERVRDALRRADSVHGTREGVVAALRRQGRRFACG